MLTTDDGRTDGRTDGRRIPLFTKSSQNKQIKSYITDRENPTVDISQSNRIIKHEGISINRSCVDHTPLQFKLKTFDNFGSLKNLSNHTDYYKASNKHGDSKSDVLLCFDTKFKS